MRELIESLTGAITRAVHTDPSDREEYARAIADVERSFDAAVEHAVCKKLDPPNPAFRSDKLRRAVRKAVMGPPGRQ